MADNFQAQNLGGGDIFTVNPNFLSQEIQADFFDFQFTLNADGSMKECKYQEQTLDPCIGQSLFLVREKYLKKVRQHKEDKKKLGNQQAEREARGKSKNHLQEHIRKSEAKLSEYKNVILAFGKLATTNPISK